MEAAAAVVTAHPTPSSLAAAYRAAAQAPNQQDDSAAAAEAACRSLLAALPMPSGQLLGATRSAAVYDTLFPPNPAQVAGSD